MFNSQVKKDVADLRKQTSQDHVTLRNRLDTNVGETRKHEEDITALDGRIKSLEVIINKFINESVKDNKVKVFMPKDEKKTISIRKKRKEKKHV